MKNAFLIIQIILSVTLVILILIQSKGVGLGSSWGGSGDFYKSRRGVEKVVFRFTIIIAGLFLISSIVNLILP